MLKRYSCSFLALVLGIGTMAVSSSAKAHDVDVADKVGLYNHKAPAKYPKWFLPSAQLGVTEWLDSAEKSASETETTQAYYGYTAKSRLPRETLENLVLGFVKSHHFSKVDVDENGKIMAFEFDPENQAHVQAIQQKRRNYTVIFEIVDDSTFSLMLMDEMAADLQ
jgi:hypothetical protein